MIYPSIQPNLTPKKLDVQSTFNVKNPIKLDFLNFLLDFCQIIELDLTEKSKIFKRFLNFC
jgi:hypothetical protein